jgi:hypothetical protein
MPFKSIACHVWAIDGYDDEATAKRVNSQYDNAANSLMSGAKDTKKWRENALATLISNSRVSDVHSPSTMIRVYGGFRSGAGAPEHMWIEYSGLIYETMPDYDMYSEAATAKSRLCPQLENMPFEGDGDGVAWVDVPMTINQAKFLGMVKRRSPRQLQK